MGWVVLVLRRRRYFPLLAVSASLALLMLGYLNHNEIQLTKHLTQLSTNFNISAIQSQVVFTNWNRSDNQIWDWIRHLPEPNKHQIDTSVIRTVRFVTNDGGYTDWLKTTDLVKTFVNKSGQVCGYTCEMELGNSRPGDADLAVFFGMHLPRRPPNRTRSDQLWMFFSEEPQDFLPSYSKLDLWNRLFNYSFTFARFSESSSLGYSFSTPVIKRTHQLHRNFSGEKLDRSIMNHVSANALWFVSNCYAGGNFKVKSDRMEYVHELSKYLKVDAFTGRASKIKTCIKQLRHLAKNETKLNPQYNDYWFYLAFENCYCKDYITEKFWKILGQDTLTIPIVMGGTSIDQYTRVAPPNSFIHVDNFTSPKRLAEHLNYVVRSGEAFNYYHQWRNEYELKPLAPPITKEKFMYKLCYICQLAHLKPERIWEKPGEDFTKKSCVHKNIPGKH